MMLTSIKKVELRTLLSGKVTILRKHSLTESNTIYESIDKDRSRLRVFLPWVDFTKSEQDTIKYITD